MKAIIIGGGIGGLTAAIALERAGIEAHVFERAASLREVGAGISLWANSVHVLDELGLWDAIQARGWSEVHSDIRDWRGAVLSSASEEMMRRGGLTVGVMHRADLLAVLAGAIHPERLHTGHECTGFSNETAGVSAHFANGHTERGDVLIGADGLHSVVRAQMFGAAPPRYSGYAAWRAVVEFAHTRVAACESWGPGRRFGSIPMSGGRVYWYATKNALEGEQHAPGDVKQSLLRLFRGWHDSIEALIDASNASAILRNDIYDREPLSRWTEKRATLLGDAAHPMTPNLGQGAGQAMEDAVVLAACLATSATVDAALREYQSRRIPRTSRIVRLSRRIGNLAQLDSPFLCFARNLVLRAMPAWMTVRQLKPVVLHQVLTPEEGALLKAHAPSGHANR